MKNKNKSFSLSQILPYVLIVCSLVGLLASFTLTYDKIHVLANPNYDPACNINPIFSCGSVMKTEQASLLGVPNTIFGIMGFTALFTFGVILSTGVLMKRWLWRIAQAAATIGVIFMHYLFFQGVFRINAICPWCFATWMITIPIFIYITAYNLENQNLVSNIKLKRFGDWIALNHLNILLTWYAIIFLILLEHFWYYWSTLV